MWLPLWTRIKYKKKYVKTFFIPYFIIKIRNWYKQFNKEADFIKNYPKAELSDLIQMRNFEVWSTFWIEKGDKNSDRVHRQHFAFPLAFKKIDNAFFDEIYASVSWRSWKFYILCFSIFAWLFLIMLKSWYI